MMVKKKKKMTVPKCLQVLLVRVDYHREVAECSADVLHVDCYAVHNSARNSGKNFLLAGLTFQCNNI